LGVGRVANNSSPYKLALLRKLMHILGPGLILWYDLSNGRETRNSVKDVLSSVSGIGEWSRGKDWIDLAHDRDRWHGEINFRAL